MSNTAKNLQQDTAEHEQCDRRNSKDRRASKEKIRFPFIDENCKLVMKDRRISERRTQNAKSNHNPFKLVGKLLKK
ncbi:MAG: hypothetical protein ACRBDX_01945 [Gammaproteobacteria bacterium]